MRRAAVSIPSNISEGYRRGSQKEYVQFLKISLGSNSELETQLSLSKELGFIDEDKFKKVYELNDKWDDFYQAILAGWKVMDSEYVHSIYTLPATRYTLLEVAKL